MCFYAGKQLKMAAEPGSLETDLSLFEQEYFSARKNDSDSESDENDQNQDECTDHGDSQASPANLEDSESMTEVRELDKNEIKDIQQFNATTCGCTKRNGSPCSDYFTVEELSELRMQMSELENDHLDLVILSQIHAHHFTNELVGHRRTDTRKSS